MFHIALWKLISLQWWGAFRQFCRSLRTFRGVLQAGIMLLMFGYFVFSMVMAKAFASVPPPPGFLTGIDIIDLVAFGLCVFTTWTVLFSSGEATVYFTASEVAFLFPAPFTRRQLLSYKLLKSSFGIVLPALMVSLTLASGLRMWGAAFFGTGLTFAFMQLLAMNVAFLRQVLQQRVHVWLRRVGACCLCAVVFVALFQTFEKVQNADIAAIASAFRESFAGSVLLAPFQLFALTILATDLASFSGPASIVLIIDCALLAAVYRMDALSLEAALAISERMTTRLKLIQAKGAWHLLGTPGSKSVRRRIPQLPFWSGLGPIVWQRMTTTLRTSQKLLWILAAAVLFAGGLTVRMHQTHPEQPGIPMIGVVMMAYLSFFISLTQQNEIERIGYLKSLPISSIAIVLGELLGFVALLSSSQAAFFLILCGIFPDWAIWLVWAAVLTLPFNFMLFAIDKLVFYVFPTRLVKGAPGDFQNGGRQMIFMSLRMLIAGFGFAMAGGAAIPGAAIFHSPVAALIPASIILILECAALVPALTMAFNRFDPSQDMPA